MQAQQLGAPPEIHQSPDPCMERRTITGWTTQSPDIVLEALKDATMEQIWGYSWTQGLPQPGEKDWVILKPGETMVGRVVTAHLCHPLISIHLVGL